MSAQAKNVESNRQKGGRRRSELLKTACEHFYDRGYATASMRDIANEMGVTQAALYYHFVNKEEILFALIEDFNERLSALLESKLDSEGDKVEGLRSAIRAHILLGRSDFREFKLVTEDKQQLGPVHAEEVRQRERQIFDLYRDCIEGLVVDRKIKNRDPSVCTFNILGIINFVFKWYRPNGPMSLDEIADQTVDFALSGLLRT
ncbi:TetR/AcrR family transcriptional regulator [Hoeflea alexandrii]|uniref:TetR/AcrR family transcriptional regulator n=1 Tax=Hoeflea alexandrii TaxID=288436 RepID=UPI0022B06058|nr:TetR/AcrR family transcriptional regulator [Hoeflea alexandrii]MCZ4291656.1 TetR/AcrR family transcriptional regulator [Hoeflea alexandrii]